MNMQGDRFLARPLLISCVMQLASVSHAAGSPACEKLLQDFDMADRSIARILIESSTDNSAPRESNRQMRVLRKFPPPDR